MLIPAFIFVMRQDLGHQPHPYPLKFHPAIEAWQDYFRFNLRRWISGFGTTSSERRLVLLPGRRIKLVIYCTSIKQREHTLCCQLIFRPTWLRSQQPSLRMLTYHLGSLSNPVNPKNCNVFTPQRYKIICDWPQTFDNYFARKARFSEKMCTFVQYFTLWRVFIINIMYALLWNE